MEAVGGDNQGTTASCSFTNGDKHSHNGDTNDNATNADVPNNNPAGGKTASTPEGVTNLAFTIDFGEESKTTLEGRSLGDLMPPRMRKSLRERKEKQVEKTSPNTSQPSIKDKITPEKQKMVEKSKPKSGEKVPVSE